MHDRSRILLLPNAWDVASARVFEAAGFRAVATTSAGLAWSLVGHPASFDRYAELQVVGRIANPSYSTRPMKLDDSLGYPDGEHVPRVEMFGAVRRIVSGVGVPRGSAALSTFNG
jgi:2-methylisocitrate lyase-like PEP mutase family enzyme